MPVVDEITNVAKISSAKLDLPISGTNVVWATNYVTISTIMVCSNPPASVHFVRVDTVWPFYRGTNKVYNTNTVADYLAPDS